jgi:hypothetical protein
MGRKERWLFCLVRTTIGVFSNLSATRDRMVLDKSLMAACLGSSRAVHTDYVWHTPALMVSQSIRGAQVIEWRNYASDRPSVKITGSNSCRKNIGLSTLSLDNSLYRKVAEEGGGSSFSKSDSCELSFVFSTKNILSSKEQAFCL